MDSPSRQLVFNGAIVLLIGLMCGAPYGRAIGRNSPAHIVHSWRVAHASLPLGAAIMFAVASVLSMLTIATEIKWLISIAFIVSSYAFCFSLPLAALTGHRGLSRQGPGLAHLVFVGNIVGALASLLAALALLYGAYVST